MSSGRALGAGAGELSRVRQVAWRRLRPQALAARIQTNPSGGVQPNEPERVKAERTQTAVRNRTNPKPSAAGHQTNLRAYVFSIA